MKIEFKMALTKADWIDFNQAYLKFTNKRRRRIAAVLIGLLLITAVISLFSLVSYIIEYHEYFALHDYSEIFKYNSDGVFLPLVYLLVSAFAFYRFFIAPKKAVNKMVNHPENQQMFDKKRLVLDSEKILSESELTTQVYDWQMVVKVIESPDFIALFLSHSACLLFPKYQLELQQLTGLETLIADNFKDEIIYIEK
ncbi:hypothetical protein M2139_001809 [Enterococcus sp. PF1-24]|uniref:YcxB family protein n=1 Tax=unclassified Enterococcus TaxID=2608891 RepID=UPI002473C97B|nr:MULTISPECIES: YcxB family protein [unclassified Enterococcus]MDH6364867.1 hypothetical protein [Enterococcus sp. PFB1-1]MDH6401909.1 hypothetical protein [Enterococcus sp. PF1-24]